MIVFKQIAWNPPPPRKMGGTISWALGDLKFLPTPGGLSQMGGLKFVKLLGGDNRVFSSGGWGKSPIIQKFTHLSPTRKGPTSRLPPKGSFPH